MARNDDDPVARRLETMLEAYERPDGTGIAEERFTYLRHAIESSPRLRRDLLEAIEAGTLERFDTQGIPGAVASYNPMTHTMSVPNPDHGHPMELVFTLGHETRHALNAIDVRHIEQTFLPAVDAISRSAERPHDYTEPMRAAIEDSRLNEARAEIGGFNAVVSAMRQSGMAVEAEDIARTMPWASKHFLSGAAGDAERLSWRGLTREADGSLAFSPGNVDAMRTHYADQLPASLGPNGLLDYRHNAILNALNSIHGAEQARYLEGLHASSPQTAVPESASALQHGGGQPPSAGIPVEDGTQPPVPAPKVIGAYHVDFDALGANRTLLDYPADGMITVTDRSPLLRNPFQEDHPDFVVPRARALENLGLPPDPRRPEWTGPGPLPPQTFPEPEHPLLRSASESLDRLGPLPALSSTGRHGDAVAAIALSAAEQRMDRIDHVVLSRDGGGLILVQGEDPASPDARRARVEIAALPPAAHSLERLEARTQAQTPEAPVPMQSLAQEDAPKIAARSF